MVGNLCMNHIGRKESGMRLGYTVGKLQTVGIKAALGRLVRSELICRVGTQGVNVRRCNTHGRVGVGTAF